VQEGVDGDERREEVRDAEEGDAVGDVFVDAEVVAYFADAVVDVEHPPVRTDDDHRCQSSLISGQSACMARTIFAVMWRK
jgi:hypothetical protein